MEGSGVKLPGHIGAYKALTSKGFELSHAAGTSGGSIVAAGAVAGYTPDELKKLVFDMNFSDLLDGSKWGWKKMWSLWRHLGMYKGDYFYQFMKDLLAEKGVYTFKDLLSTDPDDLDDPKYRWKLKVIASDITNGRILVFPNDAILFDIEPDDFEVALAVRMSMSLPIYYRPARLGDAYILAGGILSNFGIWLYDSDGKPEWPTFGFLLEEPDFDEEFKITGIKSFAKAIFKTMMVAHDRKFVRPDDYIQRTIKIPTGSVNTTDFDLTNTQKETLFHSGFKSANEFLDGWSWQSYLDWTKEVRGY